MSLRQLAMKKMMVGIVVEVIAKGLEARLLLKRESRGCVGNYLILIGRRLTEIEGEVPWNSVPGLGVWLCPKFAHLDDRG